MLIPKKINPPDELIGGCIAVWYNEWENPLSTIETIEKISTDKDMDFRFERAQVVQGAATVIDDARTNSHAFLQSLGQTCEEGRKINNRYYELVFGASAWYKKYFGIGEPIHISESFNILRYQTGEEYIAHYDGGTASKRVISPILYLNDDYTGGELEFVNQKIKLKPKAGAFYLFPANFAFAHIAHPVKTGTKYAIVTWLHDRE
jgi:predicted 2-oxoglutarate/Fe(II)-dependent dioxygenase YbiX